MRKKYAALAGVVLGLAFTINAQTLLPVQPVQIVNEATSDSIVQLTADAYGLPPAAREDLPRTGTFWEVLPSGLKVPLPCPPGDPSLPIYQLPNGSFLVDATSGRISVRGGSLTSETLTAAVEALGDSVANLIEQTLLTDELTMVSAMELQPLEAGGSYTPMNYSLSVDPGTNLWIAETVITNGYLTGIGSNTITDVQYEIQTKEDLLQSDWQSEGFIFGAALTNWTPLSVAQNGRTNLFIRLRSWQDDGSGLPIWWQLKFFGNAGVDPDADPDDDGRSNWQEFAAGTNPTVFDVPSPPGIIGVTINPATTATITWRPVRGPVVGYAVSRWDPATWQSQVFNVGLTNQFVDTNFVQNPLWQGAITYSVKAIYANGETGWGNDDNPQFRSSPAIIFSGAGGSPVLMTIGQPSGASGVKVTRYDWHNVNSAYPPVAEGTNVTFVPAGSFANGLYHLPTNATGLGYDGSSWYAQTVWSNGTSSAESKAVFAGYLAAQTSYDIIPGRFNDASSHLEQNVIVLLRAAGLNAPFVYRFDAGYGVSAVEQPTDYAYAGFWNVNNDTGEGMGYESRFFWSLPFQQNYRLRNFAFCTTNIDTTGFLNTGAAYGEPWSIYWDTLGLQTPMSFNFSSTNTTALPGLLSDNDTTWITPYYEYDLLGITLSSNRFYLPNNISNYFGLKLLSVKLAHNHNSSLILETLNANSSLPATNDTYYFYPQFAQPQLQTVGYYFGLPQENHASDWSLLASHPLPGNNDFSPANPQPLLIGMVGMSLQVAAFAKQTILNGDTAKPVYVGQYFDKAYKIDVNGNITTTPTGSLSPYGVFVPTEPGPVALVTMPSSDGQRGTGIVQVVSLVVDANHDGNMNTSLAGEDFTTEYHPMRFWANDLFDRPGSGGTLDQTYPVFQAQAYYASTNLQPNCNYGQIRCQRNLENFARLWVRGIPNLPTNQGYQVTLDLASGTWGPINLYRAYEAGGGLGYLTDTNIAAAQVAAPYGNALAFLDGWSGEYVLPQDNQGRLLQTNFLFEATMPSSSGLALSIYKDGALLARSEVLLEIDEVENMYERAVVTNVVQTWPEMVQTNVTSGFQVLASPEANPYESKQLAVFVHGWRMTAWDWENFSDLMFKRLYWQGFQGRFASLRWPTRSADTDTNTFFGVPSDMITFNRSEHIAFDSGSGAALYLYDLRQRYTNYTISACAHSQGNVVMMEALKELADADQAPLDNYVMMQAAVPAHCYDTAVPSYPTFLNAEANISQTPNTYAGYAAVIGNALRGQMVNFFNPDDYALAMATNTALGMNVSWEGNEKLFKPLAFFGYYYLTNSLVAGVVTNPFTTSIGITNLQSRTVTDPLELMPFVARPRSKAVGAQNGVSGVVNGGELDLKNQLHFGNASYDHSGEFNRNIQTPQVQMFYTNLIFGLFP